MRQSDPERYDDLDAHRTRSNIRPDAGTAYDYASFRAAVVDTRPDLLADGNVVPDLDAVADQLADAGPFAHLEQPDIVRPLSFTEHMDDAVDQLRARAHGHLAG